MPELEWKAPAVADLMAIVDYISDDSPDAALVSIGIHVWMPIYSVASARAASND